MQDRERAFERGMFTRGRQPEEIEHSKEEDARKTIGRNRLILALSSLLSLYFSQMNHPSSLYLSIPLKQILPPFLFIYLWRPYPVHALQGSYNLRLQPLQRLMYRGGCDAPSLRKVRFIRLNIFIT